MRTHQAQDTDLPEECYSVLCTETMSTSNTPASQAESVQVPLLMSCMPWQSEAQAGLLQAASVALLPHLPQKLAM